MTLIESRLESPDPDELSLIQTALLRYQFDELHDEMRQKAQNSGMNLRTDMLSLVTSMGDKEVALTYAEITSLKVRREVTVCMPILEDRTAIQALLFVRDVIPGTQSLIEYYLTNVTGVDASLENFTRTRDIADVYIPLIEQQRENVAPVGTKITTEQAGEFLVKWQAGQF